MRAKLTKHRFAVLAALACALGATTAHAQTELGINRPLTLNLAPADTASSGGGAPGDESDSQEALAKAAQNPIAAMISVPFQNNFNFGIGPNNVMQYNLNVQPVIPISLSEDWNLITRTIIPIINQPSPSPGVSSAFGLGDINPQLFFSPAKPAKLIWGVGPTFTFPTATDLLLGAGKYSAGPAVVALTIQGHWVVGAVANQQWSYAGWSDKSVSAFLIQPFVNYNLPHGWYLTTGPIMTADWEASSADRWTVPVGGVLEKSSRSANRPSTPNSRLSTT